MLIPYTLFSAIAHCSHVPTAITILFLGKFLLSEARSLLAYKSMPCPEPLRLCYGNSWALIHRLLPWYFCDCGEAPLVSEAVGLWVYCHCRNVQEVRSTSAGTMLLHRSLVLIPVITDLEAPDKGSRKFASEVKSLLSFLAYLLDGKQWSCFLYSSGHIWVNDKPECTRPEWKPDLLPQDTLINTQINVFSLFPNRISCQKYALYIFHPYLHSSSSVLMTVFCLNDCI